MNVSLIYEQIPKVAKAIGAIGKDQKNLQQGYMFRGIDAVYNACHGPMIDNGVFCTTEVSNLVRDERQSAKGGVLLYTTLLLKVTFWAADGSSITTVTAGEAMDSGDKATNKAMSAALKYAFFQTFVIPVQEMDDADKTTHELAPRHQPAPRPSQIEMTPERKAFNEWAAEKQVKAGMAKEVIAEAVKTCGGDYSAARQMLEDMLAKQSAV